MIYISLLFKLSFKEKKVDWTGLKLDWSGLRLDWTGLQSSEGHFLGRVHMESIWTLGGTAKYWTYSASVLDSDMTPCFLELHEIALTPKWNENLDIECLCF